MVHVACLVSPQEHSIGRRSNRGTRLVALTSLLFLSTGSIYQPVVFLLFWFVCFFLLLFVCLLVRPPRSCDSTSVPEAPTRGRCHCGSWRTAQAPRASAGCGVQPGSPDPRGTGEPCRCPSTGRRTGTANSRFHTFAPSQLVGAARRRLTRANEPGRHPSGRLRTEASGSSACLLLLLLRLRTTNADSPTFTFHFSERHPLPAPQN